jgi:hypothetical protein
MSTQVIRNLLNSQVDAVLSKAKQKVREEGKKQLRKLKQQIPTPQELTDKLKTDINQDSCSTEGQMKFNEKLDETQAKIDTLKTAIDQGISTLETTNETLNKVVGPDGVLEKIKVMPQVLNPVVTSLNIVSQAASTLITAVGFIPPPSTFPAGPQIIAKDAAKVASGTVSELSSLMNAIPNMINTYASKANSILGLIDSALKNLLFLKDKLDKLIAYLQYQKLKFGEDCNTLLNSGNSGLGVCSCPEYTTQPECEAAGCIWTQNGGNGIGATIDGNNIPNINDLTLNQLIDHLQNLYGNILEELQSQGDTKAIEKIYIINKEMEEWKTKYNISFKIIYI